MQPWSYSAISNFRTCPRKYFHYFVKKDVQEPTNDNMKWGFAVHAAIANRITKARPLPANMTQYERWIDYVMVNSDRTQVLTKAEHKMALDEKMEPIDYWSKQVFTRIGADVLKVREADKIARIVDWKTGKVPKYPDKMDEAKQQMGIMAIAVFKHFPAIEAIRAELVYIEHDSERDVEDRADYIYRSDMSFIWRGLTPILTEYQVAHATQEFLPKKNGLCREYCAVTSCEYHGKGR